MVSISFLLAVLLCCPASADERQAKPIASVSLPQKLQSAHLPNLIRIHQRVISGGLPEGDEAFQELRELGIRTIISVDGARPDVERAAKFGLRYVHLPHSYDGIPESRIAELAKAVRELESPIYIHCHHGKHRSPAAAAVACVGAGLIPPSMARPILTLAGTGSNYRGLYQSAESARRIDDRILSGLRAEFPETAVIPPMAEAMVALEHTHDRLKILSALDWQTPNDDPGNEAAHEALLLREHFAEMLRMDSVAHGDAGQKQAFINALQLSQEFESGLTSWMDRGKPADERTALRTAFEKIGKNCSACHRETRDMPKSVR